ncbi:MAG: protocatechuate 3,4-dioxygenase subunit alpha, partial [Actinomycetes bacterium]
MTPDARARLGLTPSQTVGPFLHIGLVWDDCVDVVPAGTLGAVWLRGHVYDGEGAPVSDAMVETWQADAQGRFDHPDDPRGRRSTAGFRAFGRCPTGLDGAWAVRTVKPGPVPTRDGTLQAPHVDLSVFARGLLDRVVTRLYFGDEADLPAGGGEGVVDLLGAAAARLRLQVLEDERAGAAGAVARLPERVVRLSGPGHWTKDNENRYRLPGMRI